MPLNKSWLVLRILVLNLDRQKGLKIDASLMFFLLYTGTSVSCVKWHSRIKWRWAFIRAVNTRVTNQPRLENIYILQTRFIGWYVVTAHWGSYRSTIYRLSDFFPRDIVKGNYFMYLHYSTLLFLPPLRYYWVVVCWDRTQDCCDFGIDCQTL